MSALDDFLAAEASQESGGNYGAVNSGTGALGKYQVLPGNVTPWAREYLGINLSPAQFLSSPSMQEALVRAVLGNYVQKYGFRGAASAWYSGDPYMANDYTAQSGGPSIGAYVDSVMAKMGSTPQQLGMVSAAAPVVSKLRPDPGAGGNQAFTDLQGHDITPAGLTLGAGAGTSATQQDAPAAGMEIGSAHPEGSGLASPVGSAEPSGTGLSGSQGGQVPVVYGTNDKLRLAALQMAQKYLGTPYVYGGTGAGGIDCSALVWRALESVGVNIPRTGRAQAAMGTAVPMDKLQPGDLVAFNGGDHVALYIGNNQVIEAAHPGTNVSIRTLGTAWDNANNMQGISLSGLYK